jgi:hypothetical protein
MNEVHVCTETTRKEQPAIHLQHMNGGPNGCLRQPILLFAEAEGKSITEHWQYKEDQFNAMRDQIEDLTTQISNLCHHNENGSRNPFKHRDVSTLHKLMPISR